MIPVGGQESQHFIKFDMKYWLFTSKANQLPACGENRNRSYIKGKGATRRENSNMSQNISTNHIAIHVSTQCDYR